MGIRSGTRDDSSACAGCGGGGRAEPEAPTFHIPGKGEARKEQRRGRRGSWRPGRAGSAFRGTPTGASTEPLWRAGSRPRRPGAAGSRGCGRTEKQGRSCTCRSGERRADTGETAAFPILGGKAHRKGANLPSIVLAQVGGARPSASVAGRPLLGARLLLTPGTTGDRILAHRKRDHAECAGCGPRPGVTCIRSFGPRHPKGETMRSRLFYR